MYQLHVIVGNVGRDPEMRYTPSGKAVTSFSVATNRQWTNDKGETVKETTWFRVTTWNKQAEVCNKYLKKGSKVLVDSYQMTADQATGGPKVWTAQDGTARASFELQANMVRFLSSLGEGHPDEHEPAQRDGEPDTNYTSSATDTSANKVSATLPDDQIPF